MNIVPNQFGEVSRKYKNLLLEQGKKSTWVIKGELHFSASFDGEFIEDRYKIEIFISAHFPQEAPIVKETGDRIPQKYHKYSDHSLCLGTPLEINTKLRQNPTLFAFIEEQIIPYLYSFSYFEKHKNMPFGEWQHGGPGIIEYYKKLLGIESDLAVLGFLRIMADDNYRGHHHCPCGSGKNLRKCHGNQILEIMTIQGPDSFAFEYYQVGKHIIDSGRKIPRLLWSRALEKKYNKSK